MAEPAEPTDDFTVQYITVRTINVAYTSSGVQTKEKPSIVLLHGFLGSLEHFRPIRSVLSQNHHVVAYDRVGFGLTSRPLPESYGEYPGDGSSKNPYSEAEAAQLLAAFCQKLKISSFVLVGHSAGGTTALNAWLDIPWIQESCKGIVLIASPLSGPPRIATFMAKWLPLITHLVVKGMKLMAPHLITGAVFDKKRVLQDNPPEWFEDQDMTFRHKDWQTGLFEYTKAAVDTKLSTRVDGIKGKVPVLLIAGKNDSIVKYKEHKQTAALLDCQCLFIEKCGHLPHVEYPQLVLKALEDFLVMNCNTE